MLDDFLDTGCFDCDLGKLRRDILQQGREFLPQVNIEEGANKQASHPHHPWGLGCSHRGIQAREFAATNRNRHHGLCGSNSRKPDRAITSGLPTIRPESRVRSSLTMGERYICRVRTEHFTLSLSSKYADGPQKALTGIHW